MPAVVLLEGKYGRDKVFIQSHIYVVYKIYACKGASDTASLKELYTDVTTDVRALTAKG